MLTSLKLRVLTLVRKDYSDFGPALAAEKLRERNDIVVSVETLRKWMTADGLWLPYIRHKPRVHQPRNRRFARSPRIPKNLHWPVTESPGDLDDMFS